MQVYFLRPSVLNLLTHCDIERYHHQLYLVSHWSRNHNFASLENLNWCGTKRKKTKQKRQQQKTPLCHLKAVLCIENIFNGRNQIKNRLLSSFHQPFLSGNNLPSSLCVTFPTKAVIWLLRWVNLNTGKEKRKPINNNSKEISVALSSLSRVNLLFQQDASWPAFTLSERPRLSQLDCHPERHGSAAASCIWAYVLGQDWRWSSVMLMPPLPQSD